MAWCKTCKNKGSNECNECTIADTLNGTSIVPSRREQETVNDVINRPLHYHKGGIDVITFVKEKVPREALEGFFQINVLKYVTRYRDKNGLEDLKKARFYLNKLIEMYEE